MHWISYWCNRTRSWFTQSFEAYFLLEGLTIENIENIENQMSNLQTTVFFTLHPIYCRWTVLSMFRLLLVMFPPISGMSIFGGICFVIFDPHLHSLSLFQWFNGKWYSKNSPLSIDAKDFIRSLFHSHSWSSNHHFHSLLPRGYQSPFFACRPASFAQCLCGGMLLRLRSFCPFLHKTRLSRARVRLPREWRVHRRCNSREYCFGRTISRGIRRKEVQN